MDNPYAAPATTDIQNEAEAVGPLLASRGARLAAALLDAAMIMAVVFPVGFATGLITFDQEKSGKQDLSQQLLGSALGICAYLLIHGWTIWTRQQTLGKLVLKIKVVRQDGSPLPPGEYLLKRLGVIWLISLIPFGGQIIGLINPLMIFRKNHHCLHDDIAKSMVIKV